MLIARKVLTIRLRSHLDVLRIYRASLMAVACGMRVDKTSDLSAESNVTSS